MINHIRTWLGNIPPLAAMSPGDEFIRPEFVPVPVVNMGQELRSVRRALFADELPRDAINVRLAVYMAIIHSSSLASFVTETDPRLTYLPDGSDLFGSDLSAADMTHAVTDVLEDLELLNSSSSTFFDSFPTYGYFWNQPNDPIRRLASVLLATAALTEKAAVGQ